MSYRIDHEESIETLVSKLKEEHEEIDRKLRRILEVSQRRNADLKVAVSMLNAMRPLVLRHAVEEEARLAKVIMSSAEARKKSQLPVGILQEHRRIKEFYDELPYLLEENSETQATNNILEFIDLVLEHHAEEENEIFPLALAA